MVIAVVTSMYQRMTGPTYPIRGSAVVGETRVSFKLERSWDGDGDAEILFNAPDPRISGVGEFRRYLSKDEWSRHDLKREGDTLIARLPHQPPAGKVEYRVSLGNGTNLPVSPTIKPVIIRFRGAVSLIVVIPHVLAMVAAMLFAARAALEGWAKGAKTYALTRLTVVSLVVGGFIFGPLMQKYAFGDYWTGLPFGHDLTDNKTAVALVVWLLALWRIKKNRQAGGWAIAAALVMLAVWLIPHSVLGS